MAEQKPIANSEDMEQTTRITSSNLTEKGLVLSAPSTGIVIDEVEGRHGTFYIATLKMNDKPVDLVFSSKRLLHVIKKLKSLGIKEFRLCAYGQGFDRHFKAFKP